MKPSYFLSVALALAFTFSMVNVSEAHCRRGGCCYGGGGYYGYHYMPPPPPPVYLYRMPHRHFYHRPYGGYYRRGW